MKRRSFLKIIAGIAIAPMSFIAAPVPAPLPIHELWNAEAGYKRGKRGTVVLKLRHLQATWTSELQEDLNSVKSDDWLRNKAIHGI